MGKGKLLKMFRVSIIGVGKWGKNYISTIEENFSKKIEIVAVSKLNIKKKNFSFPKMIKNMI